MAYDGQQEGLPMSTTITLPEELGKRIAAAAEERHMAIDVLAIDALERFLDALEDAGTRLAIARFKAGEISSTPGEAVFARYLAAGVFTQEDLAAARAEALLDPESDTAPSVGE
jgi:predicted transcriptional regulator